MSRAREDCFDVTIFLVGEIGASNLLEAANKQISNGTKCVPITECLRAESSKLHFIKFERVYCGRKQLGSALKLASKDAHLKRECCSHHFVHKQQRSSPPTNSDQGLSQQPRC